MSQMINHLVAIVGPPQYTKLNQKLDLVHSNLFSTVPGINPGIYPAKI